MDKDKFGKFVTNRRKEKNMTQKELAEILYLTDKAVSKWERGLSLPDISILEPLANALDITVMELLKGECIEDKSCISTEDAKQLIHDSIAISDAQISRVHAKSKNIIIFCIVCLMLLISIILNIISFTTVPETVQDNRKFSEQQDSIYKNEPEYEERE